MLKEFMDKLNDAETNSVDLGVMEIDKGKKKAKTTEIESKEESEEEKGKDGEEEASDEDIKTEIFQKALEMAGYENDEEDVYNLVHDLEANGLEIDLSVDYDKDEIIKTLADYISGGEEEDEEKEEHKEHEESETPEEEKEEHMEESVKNKKKIIKENAMNGITIGIKQVDKISRSLGALTGLISDIKSEELKAKFNKIFNDLDSVITDLSAETEIAPETLPAELPTDEGIPANEEEPTEPEIVNEPTDEEEPTEETPATEEEMEEPKVESFKSKKPTISESANSVLNSLDWIE